MFRYALILMIICLVSASILVATYKLTHPVFLELLEQEEKGALEEILPEAIDFKEKQYNESSYFLGRDSKGKTIGYIIRAEASGYSSIIKMLVGIDKQGTIIGIKILSQQETPGLGARVTEVRTQDKEPWFTHQFKGKNYKDLNLDNIESITAATITSTAVVEGLEKEIVKFLNYIQ